MIRVDWLSQQFGLPPGQWPVSHRALLGFAADGPLDVAEIESRVVERMNLLRVHQLREPDTVTEGMNRLAAAMVALTSPVPLPVAPLPAATVPVVAPLPVAPLPVVAPLYTVVEVLPDLVPLPPPVAIPIDSRSAERIEPYAFRASSVIVPIAPSPEPILSARSPSRQVRRARTRREWYVRLAELRKPLEPLTAMRTWVISTFNVEARSVTVAEFVEAVNQLRVYLPLYADLIGDRGRPGERVAAILQSPADGQEIRREFLARSAEIIDELREMQFAIEREMAAIRKRLNYGRDRGVWRMWVRPVVRKCLRYPEIVCVGIGGLATTIACWRSW